MTMKLVRPVARTSLQVTFRMPYSSVPLDKTIPTMLQGAVIRVLTDYLEPKAITDIEGDFEKCAFLEPASFFENVVGVLCTWHDKNIEVRENAVLRRKWLPQNAESNEETLVSEGLLIEKWSDSDSLRKMDAATYVYNASDTKHKSEWHVLFSQEKTLKRGKYLLDGIRPSPTFQPAIVPIPVSPKTLQSTVNFSLRKSGMHRELVTEITNKEISPPTTSLSCRIVQILLLPDALFVDKYEVEEIARFGGPTTTLYKDIDLEKPSFQSSSNIVVVSKSVDLFSTKETLTLPIHYRYQRPQQEAEYTNVSIPHPIVFNYCWKTSRAYPPVPGSAFIAGFLMGRLAPQPDGHYFFVHNATQQASHPIVTQWPNGVWNDERIVSSTTFALTLAMSALTIATIFYYRKK